MCQRWFYILVWGGCVILRKSSLDYVGEKSFVSWGDSPRHSHDPKPPTWTSTTPRGSLRATKSITCDACVPTKTNNKSKETTFRTSTKHFKIPHSSPKPGAMPEVLLDKDEPSNSSDLVNENHSSQNMEEGSPSIEINSFRFIATSLPPQ